MRLLLIVCVAVLMSGCSPLLKASDLKDWPLKSTTAEITCDGGKPIKAKLDNGVIYALNGTTATSEGLNLLDWNSGQFLPHPDPKLRELGMEFALLDTFNAAAERVCH